MHIDFVQGGSVTHFCRKLIMAEHLDNMKNTITGPIAIIGSTGLLGQALTIEAKKRGVNFFWYC